jgi:dienelactone hydrolase
VVRFGPNGGLVGILTVPRTPRPGAPHVVLVSAGVVHRVGPARLYVDVARALAERGVPVLRFDLSGLGDAEAVRGGASLNASAVADTRAALDYLAEARGATRFVAAGLCSGANHALLTAFADARVAGVLLVDPTVRRTRRSRAIHLAQRLAHGPTLRSLVTLDHPALRGLAGRARPAHAGRPLGAGASVTSPDAGTPDDGEVRARLEALLARGARLMFVFTGGVNYIYNYRDQLLDLLPGLDWRGQMRLEFMPDTDHLVSDGPSRADLLRAVTDWADGAFPAAPGGGE